MKAQPSLDTIATRYDLIGNIVHEGDLKTGGDTAYVLHKSNDQW